MSEGRSSHGGRQILEGACLIIGKYMSQKEGSGKRSIAAREECEGGGGELLGGRGECCGSDQRKMCWVKQLKAWEINGGISRAIA